LTAFDNSDNYVHSAPWSVADQGKRNVSHGCINISPSNAKWFCDNFGIGDPIVVRTSSAATHKTTGPGLADLSSVGCLQSIRSRNTRTQAQLLCCVSRLCLWGVKQPHLWPTPPVQQFGSSGTAHGERHSSLISAAAELNSVISARSPGRMWPRPGR
jgi:L,D-transpeptidase catalytic domain